MKRTGTIIAIGMAVAAIAIGVAGCGFIRNDALNQAALSGDAGRIRELLSQGADVNGRGMHAMTPVLSAARGGHLEVVQLLVEKGAAVNDHNDSGSALMWAVSSGNEDLVAYLLQNGADAKWTNSLGTTAVAIARGQKKTNLVNSVEARAQ